MFLCSLIGCQECNVSLLCDWWFRKDTKPAGSVVHITLRNVLAMLRRCCNHPYLIEYPLLPDGQFRVDEELVSSSCKLALLDRMLVKLHAGGHKVRVGFKYNIYVVLNYSIVSCLYKVLNKLRCC